MNISCLVYTLAIVSVWLLLKFIYEAFLYNVYIFYTLLVFQITRLDCYVKMQMMLECCQIPIVLFNCIPGQKKCPNPTCQSTYKYSWCTGWYTL